MLRTCRMLGVCGVLGSSLAPALAAAQATSECYFDKGRMVDAQPLGGQKESTQEQTGNLHYLLHLPTGHDKAKKWPVVVFMHGSGEIDAEGDNLNGLTKHSLPRIAEDPMFDYPFIVVSPQIDSAGWVSHAADVGAVLDRMEAEFGGDPNRLYLTGLSYGGVGTYAVGIALADRIAALMPVTPGGSVANWDQRQKIANLPIWLFMGATDKEYTANTQRVTELEASGAGAFFEYTYAFADEYEDAVPKDALREKHVFGTYEMIGHDVWHATYGVYCPTLGAQKTVQYDWLLAQSKDGSPFVDPRDPNAGTGGAAAAGAGGVGGSGAAGAAAGGTPTGGAATGGGAGAPSSSGGAPSAGGTSSVVAGSSSFSPRGQNADDAGGCSMAPASPKKARSGAWLLLGVAAFGAAIRRRRRAAPRRGGAPLRELVP